jgi:ABC-type Fe3+-hydroxamate transport system substrate-binding protein
MNLIQNNKLACSLFKYSIVIVFLLMTYIGFSQNAKRVVSLAPSITENIYLLGAKDKLIACTSYCTQAVEDGVQQIGSTIDVNVEKIFALQPDLVLTMELTKSQDLQAMKKLGLNVVMIPTPKSFDEICAQTLRIGKLIGVKEAAQKVIAETKQTVNAIKEKSIQRNSQTKIFFQIGASPIFTVLQNTFMDDFILMVNGENIANGLTKGTMTRESVLVRNPDVIIIASMGGFGNEELKTWSNFKGINAVKNDKVFIISSETSCSPTPLNFVQALNEVYNFVSQ